jgi:hypothetical protein
MNTSSSFFEFWNIINNSQIDNQYGILIYDNHNLYINNTTFINNRNNGIGSLFTKRNLGECVLKYCFIDLISFSNPDNYLFPFPLLNFFINTYQKYYNKIQKLFNL